MNSEAFIFEDRVHVKFYCLVGSVLDTPPADRMAHVEPELSAQEKAADPPDWSYDSLIPTTQAYVPATVKKVPMRITNTLQQTIGSQNFELFLPLCQLSYSHIPPIGWKHRRVPSKAPISDTRESKTGIVLAMIKAITMILEVQPSQQTQCVMELLFKCLEPRRR